ncbi:MAG TPA: M23 family metallopeptidase [Nevskia sp.]|nr:M23 family metallopeptidase [Nevskia sp.]
MSLPIRPRQLLAACLALCAGQALADAYTLRGDFEQGAVVFGSTDPAATVEFNGRRLLLTAKGGFVFGFDRDAGPDAALSVALPGQPAQVKHYAVRRREWEIQRIEGLPPKLVNPPPETAQRIAAEAKLIKAAHERDSAIDDFAEPFVWPSRGRISGVFGSQRILNGTPKQPHYGVDVAVPTGTPVVAPAGGVVALAEPDLYFTGGTLIIDHGHGLSSVLVHLSKLLVRPGERVRQGQRIALSGMTGRATGPHLHWGVYWFGEHVDAQRLVGNPDGVLDRRPKE